MAHSNKSIFCIRPFNSAVISTDGFITPCCQFVGKKFNINNSDIKNYWDSDYLKNLRKKFLNDEKPQECRRCWDKEFNNLTSHRIESNFQYKSIFKNNYERNLKLIKKSNLSFPEDVEFSITNICNLACQMCTGAYSSKLLIENNFLKFENLKQKDYNFNKNTDDAIEEISKHDIKLLNLRGGEPLVNKIIIKLIKKLSTTSNAKNMTLHITTNGTTCDDKILDLLKKFKKIRLMLSIESFGKYNDYMRYPSNWLEIEKNIFEFQKLTNTYLYINTVVQNLNILYLEQLIEFAYQNKLFLNFDILKDPYYLEYKNLPLDLLKESYKRITQIKKKKLVHTKNIHETILLLKENIDNYSYDEKKFIKFSDMIKKRDKYRKISIADYMPEIYKVI
jgi:radical SAM protein with 4Fe4S-binding SPASM domain